MIDKYYYCALNYKLVTNSISSIFRSHLTLISFIKEQTKPYLYLYILCFVYVYKQSIVYSVVIPNNRKRIFVVVRCRIKTPTSRESYGFFTKVNTSQNYLFFYSIYRYRVTTIFLFSISLHFLPNPCILFPLSCLRISFQRTSGFIFGQLSFQETCENEKCWCQDEEKSAIPVKARARM